MNKLFCINCQKEVAYVKGQIDGITTWFPVCSECLFNVKGWTRNEIENEIKNLKDSRKRQKPQKITKKSIG